MKKSSYLNKHNSPTGTIDLFLLLIRRRKDRHAGENCSGFDGGSMSAAAVDPMVVE